MQIIDPDKISVSPLSIMDDSGKVFHWHGRLFRAVRKERVAFFRDLFKSGLVDVLVKAGYMPESRFTKYSLKGYGLIIEHFEIPFITYPYEWTYSMLQDAALLVLEINRIAAQYGYELRDCHANNIVFHDNRPCFVDFGSLTRKKEGSKGWLAYEEFVRYYLYTLRIWARGDHYTAQRWLGAGKLVPIKTYLLYTSFFLRHVSWLVNLVSVVRSLFFKYRLLSCHPVAVFRENVPQKYFRILDMLFWFVRKRLLPFQKVSLKRLQRKTRRLRKRDTKSRWAAYQKHFQNEDGSIKSTPRFDRIVQLVRELKIKTITEIAGNQGVFARLLVANGGVRRVITSDYDDNAVDCLYRMVRGTDASLIPVVLDPFLPETAFNRKTPAARFRSEAVVALALLHHLLLVQGYSIDYILNRLAEYATRFVIVEFMPLGKLGRRGAPLNPSWYTEAWFSAEFGKHFQIVHREQLEKNRILYIGKKFPGRG